LKVFIFATHLNDFVEAVKARFQEDRIELCTTAGGIARRLSGSRDGRTIAVLLPADEEELIDIYSIRNSLGRIPVLLVLPNRDKFVEAMGYRLNSRIVCYRESNIVEALSALKKYIVNSSGFRPGKIEELKS
jgi:hypothetical protein